MAPDDRPAPPDWVGAPEDMLGVNVLGPRVLARTEGVVVWLAGLTAYPAGCVLHVRIAARRRDQSERQWAELRGNVLGLGEPADWLGGEYEGLWRVPESPERRLVLGVELKDGRRATWPSSGIVPWDPETPPQLPVLTDALLGSSSSGGEDRCVTDRAIWLHPVPAEEFSLTLQWPAAGVPMTRSQLDGRVIRSAGRLAEPFWPETS